MSKELVQQIIDKFAENLREYIKRGCFSRDYITTEEYTNGSKCHARVLGLLVKTGLDLGFVVDVERKLHYDLNKYPAQPDLIYVDEIKDRVIIEYESQNTGWEYGVYKRDCNSFKGYVTLHQPDVCLLIATPTTLDFTPSGRVNKYERDGKELYRKIKNYFIKTFKELDKATLEKTTFCLCVLDEIGLHPKIFNKNNKLTKLRPIELFT